MDQRKVNMLAREYAETLRPKRFKPVILSHRMLPGLLEVCARRRHTHNRTHATTTRTQGQEKMSKSDPNSAIFMEDTEQEVNTKIKRAFCPPTVCRCCDWMWQQPLFCSQVVEGNPCISYVEMVIFAWFGKFEVKRNADNGGDKYGLHEWPA